MQDQGNVGAGAVDAVLAHFAGRGWPELRAHFQAVCRVDEAHVRDRFMSGKDADDAYGVLEHLAPHA